jgi:hypothetical protein
MRAERLAAIRGPTDALESVSRFIIAHSHDASEAQGASGGAEQEMLRQGASPSEGIGPNRHRGNRAPTRLYSRGGS